MPGNMKMDAWYGTWLMAFETTMTALATIPSLVILTKGDLPPIPGKCPLLRLGPAQMKGGIAGPWRKSTSCRCGIVIGVPVRLDLKRM